MCERIKKCLTFVSLLKVEPFMLLFVVSQALRRTPLEVMIQDKLCRNTYNMSEDFCLRLPYMKDNELNHEIKTRILSDAVHYNMYHTWITVTPGIFWSILLGAWIDKYIGGRKAIFIIGSITQSLEAAMNSLNSYYFNSNINWILVSFIPYTLSGSMTYTTAFSYVAVTTPTKLRTIRVAILEVLLAISNPLGVYFSGKLIILEPFWSSGELHNYGQIFMISSFGAFIAFLWAVFIIDQQKDKNSFEKNFTENVEILGKKKIFNSESSFSDNNNNNQSNINPLRLLFDINNAKEIVRTSIKKRPDYVRAQIWLIFGAMFCGYIITQGPLSYFFQFVEKIYQWDARIYTELSSIGMIANSLVIIFITPILIKVLKLNDMLLSIIGFCGSFLHMITLGAILSPMGYLIALVFNCTSSLGTIGYRTHLSKIVEPTELGKVFTLMAVIDGFAPIIAAAVFTVIFENTIDSLPGTCFIILAGITIIPIAIAMSIDYLNSKVNKINSRKQLETSFANNSNNNINNFCVDFEKSIDSIVSRL